VLDDLLERWKRLDVLVENACISFAKPLSETTLAEWRKLTLKFPADAASLHACQ
jgi:NADP-dependent 3-hydroxy acid dehydrogenase YdfG